MIAANNIVNAAFVVASAGFAITLRHLGASIPELFLVTALLHLVVVMFAFRTLSWPMLRLLTTLVLRAVYRLRVIGAHHLPESGPALIVANHVSFVDALFLGILSPRPVRFVMDHRIYRTPLLGSLFRVVRAIPIAPRHEDPAQTERAFGAIDEALGRGEIVAIFPEGHLTRDGSVDVFRPGLERILQARPVPVVPVALRGLWGSFFSRRGRQLRDLPRELGSRVEVVVGARVAAAEASAEELRHRVLRLRGSTP
jgi:1-acyl-sn-glycerol-3-phosphate acyltransferase